MAAPNPHQLSLIDPPLGTPVDEIVRHDAVDTSVEAAKRVDTSKWERLCLTHCRSRGIWGVTNAETAQYYVRPVGERVVRPQSPHHPTFTNRTSGSCSQE